jgi:uncharacterized protein (TIGR02147 family)
MANIFGYTDFHKYLLDLTAAMQEGTAVYSQRVIARKMGLDPGNFSRILKGERSFPGSAVDKLATSLKLKKREREYLHALYDYHYARGHKKKRSHFEQMLRFRESKVRHIASDKYEFFERWYYSAVREVLGFFKYDGTNAAELGRLIVPAITARQVERAMQILAKLKLVRQNVDGFWYRTDEVINAGPVARGLSLNNYLIATMSLARDALEQPGGTVQFSSTNLTLSEEAFNEVAEEIRHLRRKVLEMARDCSGPDRVYQLNFQFFPLTRQPDSENGQP